MERAVDAAREQPERYDDAERDDCQHDAVFRHCLALFTLPKTGHGHIHPLRASSGVAATPVRNNQSSPPRGRGLIPRKPLLAVTLVALALPAPAWAHAVLIRTVPGNGSVLVAPPPAVRVVFDDLVRPGPGIAAIRNSGGSVLAG